MKRWLFILLAGSLALPAVAAGSTKWTTDPKLNTVASLFAMRPVTVRCYEKEEPNSPWFFDAWGYVDIPTAKAKFTAIDSRLCAGALNVNDTTLPRWQRALGVSVLTHEAYHLRRWGAAGNEAKVECQAIRHWKVSARLLGMTEEVIEDVWPWALAAHYRLTEYVDWTGERPYYDPTCVVPPLWQPPD